MAEVTVLELHKLCKEIVNKYPYYTVEVCDDLTSPVLGSKELINNAVVIKKSRKLILKSEPF